MTVNRERVQQLVNALRSGDYLQGHHFLATVHDGVTKFYCLGVACEVAITNGLPLLKELFETPLGETIYEYGRTPAQHGHVCVLPHQVANWYGFTQSNPTLPALNVSAALILDAVTLNDHYGFSLNDIADCFEHTYLQGGDSED